MVVEKVQSRLRAMGANLSKERLQQWTDKLSKGFTEESTDEEINNFVDGFKDLVVEQARQDDRIRSLENQKPKPDAVVETPKAEEKPKEDATIELLKALQAEIQGLKTEKMQETLFDKFKKDERNKNIPSSLLESLAPQTSEDYESAVERINSIAVEFNKSSLPNTTPPNSTGNPKQATDQEIKNLAKDIC